jgi:Flp pilus assembly pilin Flp
MMDRFNIWVGTLVARIEELKSERGQTAVEYALMLVVVVLGLVAATLWGGLDTAIQGAVKKISDAIAAA